MAGKLNNLEVIISRQSNLAADLIAKIHEHGGKGISFPLFDIESLLNTEKLLQINKHLQQNYLTICISRNAADLVLSHVDIPQDSMWATIGPATALYLQQHNINNVIYPYKPPFDSKALIIALQLKRINLANLCIMILTGELGDRWLLDMLTQHGAIVEIMHIYRRIMPRFSAIQLKDICSAHGRRIILITCVTSLVNLQTMARQAGVDVYNIALLVVSDRIYAYAVAQGFANVYVAKSMLDADILSALFEYEG